MSDSFRWGRWQWGAVPFAFSADDGISHSMRTRLGVSTNVYAKSLGTSHILKTTLRVKTDAVSIGYGPGAIHSLQTVLTVDAPTGSAPLKFSHPLKTTLAVAVTTGVAPLRFGHTMRTTLVVTTDAFGILGVPQFLRTILAVETDAYALGLKIGHSLRTTLRVLTVAAAAAIVDVHLPTIIEVLSPLDPNNYVVGILNLIRNPAVVTNLEDWSAFGDAMIELDDTRAWYGDHSAKLFSFTLGNGGLMVQTVQGMAMPIYGGSVLWSGVRVAAQTAGTVVSVRSRARYTDGTIVDGDAAEVLVTADGSSVNDWQVAEAPFFSLDETKLLSTAWVLVEPVAADEDQVIMNVGAAQVEYDLMMYGPAPTIALDSEAA